MAVEARSGELERMTFEERLLAMTAVRALVEAGARQPIGRMAVRADDVQVVTHGLAFRNWPEQCDNRDPLKNPHTRTMRANRDDSSFAAVVRDFPAQAAASGIAPALPAQLRLASRRGLCRLRRADRFAFLSLRDRLPHGQTDGEPRSAALLTLDLDRSTVPAHDRVRHRQAEAGPLSDRLRREKRLEDPMEMLFWNAAARVVETNPGLARAGAGRDRDRAARLDRLAGVDDQVEEHLV